MVTSDHELKRTTRYPDPTLTSRSRNMGKVEKNACEEIQKEALTEGMYLPLGQYFQSAAWRTNLTGHVKAQPPLFWNVKKA